MKFCFVTIVLLMVLFLLLDMLYFTIIEKYMKTVIQKIQKSPLQIKWISAATCYLFLAFALYWFIIREKRSTQDAFLLGILIYGIYESTNYALLDSWPIQLALLDTLWGGILMASVRALYCQFFML